MFKIKFSLLKKKRRKKRKEKELNELLTLSYIPDPFGTFIYYQTPTHCIIHVAKFSLFITL